MVFPTFTTQEACAIVELIQIKAIDTIADKTLMNKLPSKRNSPRGESKLIENQAKSIGTWAL
jgi:hypothetical protein